MAWSWSLSAAAVVVDGQGRVLLQRRRDRGTWEIPGGAVEAGETVEAAAAREVREETGVDVVVGAVGGVYRHVEARVVCVVFSAAPTGGAPGPTVEASEAGWFAPDVATGMVPETFRLRIVDALAGGWPQVRDHDGLRWLDGPVVEP